jgi:hypothetical protein
MTTTPSHSHLAAQGDSTRFTDHHTRFNLALAFFVPPAFTNIDWKTYMIFGTFCFLMFFHVFFTYPETCGRTLEEIDLVFEGNVPAWRSGKVGGDVQGRAAAKERTRKAEPSDNGMLGQVAGDNVDAQNGTAVPKRNSGSGKEEISHHETV